jgi:signal peptidase
MASRAGSVSVAEPVLHHRHWAGPRDTSAAIVAVRRLLATVWLVSLGTIVLLALATNLGPKVGFEVFAIRGGSMTPTIPVGAAVVAMHLDPGSIEVGDVITIRADNGVVFTHRVVEIDDSEADHWLRTKGDANTTADAAPIPEGSVVGKVVVTLPLVGYLIAMMASPAGMLSFLAFVAALMIAIWGLEEAEGAATDHRRLAGRSDVARA